MRNFRFLRKNDGTEITDANNYLIGEYNERISDLENRNTILHQQLTESQNTVQRLASRAYPDITQVRDEERIDRSVSQHFTNRDDFVMHLRRQQASRIVQKLLENNLIEHTFTQDDVNGDFISRMKIKVQNIL